jgi:hypothetical protein
VRCTRRSVQDRHELRGERLEGHEPVECVLNGTRDPVRILWAGDQQCIGLRRRLLERRYIARSPSPLNTDTDTCYAPENLTVLQLTDQWT